MKCEIEEYTPRRATKDSAGYDFFSPVDVDVVPGEWTEIDTLVSFDGTESLILRGSSGIEFPPNWCMKIYPRSGLSFKTGFRIINTVGIIDKDYRGTIKLKITADVPLHISKGDRIAQGVFETFLVLNKEIEPTEERTGGFGSTGV